MVFTKLNNDRKEELAIFKAEHGTTLTSSMRALVMRGSTVDDARNMVLSREAVRAELLKEIEKEIIQEVPVVPAVPVEIIKKPRAPRKAKTEDKMELKDIPEEGEPEPDYKHIKIVHPKPKKEPKPKAKAKAKAKKEDESGDVNIIL